MIINTGYIYQFGKWKEKHIDFHSSFTIIEGPNESGKTSFKQFIIYILFDLPSSMKKLYEPKGGGAIGGKLFITTSTGESIVIERVANKNKGRAICFTSKGEKKEETWLTTFLQGMDRLTYEGIFSFGNYELQKIRQLKGEDLGKVLFGIGMTGSDKIAYLEKDLEKKTGDLFKKKGKIPHINQHIQKMKDIQSTITRLEAEEGTYNELIRKIENIDKRLTTIRDKKEQLEKENLILGKYYQAKEAIQQYQFLREEMKQYKEFASFPSNGIKRYEQLKELMLPLISDLNVVKNGKQEAEQEMNYLSTDLLNEDVYERLLHIDEMVKDYDYKQKEREEKSEEYKRNFDVLAHELRLLGIDLTIEDVQALQIPVQVEETWKTLAQGKQQLQLRQDQLVDEEEKAKRELGQVKAQIEKKKATLLPTDMLHSMKELLEQARVDQIQQQLFQENRMKAKQQETKLHNMLKQGSKANKHLIAITSLIGFSFIVYGFFRGGLVEYLAGLISLLVGVAGSAYLSHNNKLIREQIESQTENELVNNIRDISETELNEARHRLQSHEENKKDFVILNNDFNHLEASLHNIIQRKEGLQTEKAHLQEQIQLEQNKFPFLKWIDVSHWPSMYYKLVKYKQKAYELEQQEAVIIRLDEQIKEIDTYIQNLAEKCNILNQHESINLNKELLNLKNVEQQKRETLRFYRNKRKELDKEIQELQQKLSPYEEQLQQLLEHAQVESEEQFLFKGEQYEKYNLLKEKQEDWLTQIKLIFPNEASNIAHENIDWDLIAYKRQQLVQLLNELQEEKEYLQEQRAELLASCKQLEENEQLSNHRHQFALYKNELRSLARKWAIYKTAKEVIVRTKEVYENEYLPEIMEKTSIYFYQLTDGKYVKVVPPTPNEAVQVLDSHHTLFNVKELSEGTAAQLYVSLRLALNEVMSDQYGLPFIIDDAFVHFDYHRRNVMYKILHSVAETQQIIYFTCHDSEVSMLHKLSSEKKEKASISIIN
ncbi:AAA family ATPase [Salirhabdus salicampi]|uniref:AAA family ATPase n=1 Tax=Salirhabdus salicampi TaxID=476102 RepID=UPI0020C304D3|nr:AAA family ATPase [Salirhabdus salicampi]MCP8615494.1 AAA family ATPase [Salirhabdus salicampi]